MIETIQTLNFYAAAAGIVVIVISAILVIDAYREHTLRVLIRTYGYLVAFVTVLGSMGMTLLYSEVFGFVPCGLCWLQRIALYPQAILLALALWRKDKMIGVYGIALSIPGLIVALYQHYLQMGGHDLGVCPTAGPGADCAERILYEFGFVTFPLLSAILFIFLIVLYWYVLREQK